MSANARNNDEITEVASPEQSRRGKKGHPTPIGVAPSRGDGKQESLDQVRDQITDLAERHLSSGVPGIELLAGTPGVGKSLITSEVINRRPDLRIAYFVPRHDLVDSVPGRQIWQHIRGRSHLNCAHDEIVVSYAKKGNRATDICDVCCFRNNGCTYWSQFDSNSRVRILPIQYVWANRSVWSDCDAIVIDEMDWSVFIQKLDITRADLARSSAANPIISALHDISAELGQDETLDGFRLYARLQDAAARNGLTIKSSLATWPDNPIDLWADFPPRLIEIPTASHVSNMPDRFVGALLDTIRDESRNWEQDIRFNQTVYLSAQGIELYRLRRLPHELTDRPLLILSAGSEDNSHIYEQIFKVEILHTHAPSVSFAPGVRIVQDFALQDTKEYLTEPSNLAAIRARLLELLRDHRGNKVGIITFMEIAPKIGDYLRGSGFIDVKHLHFWADKGSNDFEDRDVLVVLGNPIPNIEKTIRQARALYSTDTPISTHGIQVPGMINPVNGSVGWQIPTWKYQDSRLNAVVSETSTLELYQAVHRIRPVLENGSAPKQIIVMAKTPVKGLFVNEVLGTDPAVEAARHLILANGEASLAEISSSAGYASTEAVRKKLQEIIGDLGVGGLEVEIQKRERNKIYLVTSRQVV